MDKLPQIWDLDYFEEMCAWIDLNLPRDNITSKIKKKHYGNRSKLSGK